MCEEGLNTEFPFFPGSQIMCNCFKVLVIQVLLRLIYRFVYCISSRVTSIES
jgi:hypothetical protein